LLSLDFKRLLIFLVLLVLLVVVLVLEEMVNVFVVLELLLLEVKFVVLAFEGTGELKLINFISFSSRRGEAVKSFSKLFGRLSNISSFCVALLTLEISGDFCNGRLLLTNILSLNL